MATRAVIARPKGDEWIGRYHHWDGYPTQLGATLFALVTERGLDWTRRTLLDEHGAWSTINGADWSLAPGFGCDPAPACYCHGQRSEEGFWIAPDDDNGTEWCYVLGQNGLVVYKRNYATGAWVYVATVPWTETAPEWAQIEQGAVTESTVAPS